MRTSAWNTQITNQNNKMALYRITKKEVGVKFGESWNIICPDTLKQGCTENPDRNIRNIFFQDGSRRTEDIGIPILVLIKSLPFHPKVGDVITFVGTNYRILEIKGVGNFAIVTFFNEKINQNQEVYLNKVSRVIRMPHE